MENISTEELVEPQTIPNPPVVDSTKIKRELDSLDDFEHLEHIPKDDSAKLLITGDIPRALVDDAPINNVAAPVTAFDASDELTTNEPMEEDFLKKVSNSESTEQIDTLLNGLKATTQNLLDYERGAQNVGILEPSKIQPTFNDLADKFTDSDPDLDIDEDRYVQEPKFASADDLLRADSPTALPSEQFKDVLQDNDVYASESSSVSSVMPSAPPAEISIEEFLIEPDEPVREFIEADVAPVEETEVETVTNEKIPIDLTPTPSKPEVGIMQAEEMFLKMGLDTWFNPERLHPTVESLIYWRDPKKSGAVFGGILIVLLSLAYFSLISVTAYISLFALLVTICFRIYKNIMQAVQKTSDGHPFKEILELDLTLPQDRVKEVTELVVAHINGGVNELRRLFLVEDLIDSIKFGVLLWSLTYVGAWFNGMTLIIIGFVALFTLPKVYETNKTQIDANLDIVRTKLAEFSSKVKAAVPIGKKSEEKKEQ